MDQDAPVETLVFGGFAALPTFAPASVPSEEEFAHAQGWALDAGLVMEARAYEDVISGRYLPEMVAEEEMADGDE